MDFYTLLSKFYHLIFPANIKEKQLLDTLLTKVKPTALDIGCGIGNTTSFLKSHANHVIGIDMNSSMIEKAKKNVGGVDFLVLDMRQLNTLENINADIITCFGNTLVHINKDEIKQVIDQISNLANNGANIFIQIINYDRIYKHNIQSLPTIDHEYVSMQRNYSLFEQHLIFTSVLTDKKTKEVATQSVTLYPLFYDDLISMLEEAGLKVIHRYGSFNQDLWHDDSYATIIHAIKKD